MSPRLRQAVGVFLLLSVVAGLVVRAYPYHVLGLTLADLDPFRYLRLVETIVEHGHIPTVDSVTWPFGSSRAIYAINQGYGIVMAELVVLSALPAVQVLSLTPLALYVVLLASVYLFARQVSGDRLAAWLALGFMSFTPSWWLLVGYIGANPLAENLALIYYFLSLTLLATAARARRTRWALVAGLFAGSSWTLHPATLYFILGTAVAAFIRLWPRPTFRGSARGAAAFCLGLVPFTLLLLPWWSAILSYSGTFARGAGYISSLRGEYFTLKLRDVVPNEIGGAAGALAVMGVCSMVLRPRRRYRPLLGGVAFCALLIVLSNIPSFRAFLDPQPGSVFVLLSHRIVPYFLPLVYAASGIAVTGVILPLSRSWGGRPQFRWVPLLLLMIVLTPLLGAPQTVRNARLFAEFNPVPSSDLLRWLSAHTTPADVLAVNNLTKAVAIKTLVRRPTLASLSYEDIAEDDFVERLQTDFALFSVANTDQEAQAAAARFRVTHVIVFRDLYYVDVRRGEFVAGRPDASSFQHYLRRLKARRFLHLVYEDPQHESYIFRIRR